MKKTLRSRRAVSPVIATVILVAVAITVAVAVSYWMGGIAGQYTSFEKVEIQSAYAIKFESPTPLTVGDPKGWKITISLQNTGSAEATLVRCFINDMPLGEYPEYGTAFAPSITWVYLDDSGAETLMPPDGLTIPSGVKETIVLTIASYYCDDATPGLETWDETGITLSSGTTINIKLHSANGMDYIRLVQLT